MAYSSHGKFYAKIAVLKLATPSTQCIAILLEFTLVKDTKLKTSEN